ncbi:hypothetical protein [Amnibacterium setariae]|uniref:Uncharacterized protein n=1 Tax=Amnibacterium setariae TaxID=2306585 RepID=A0A3A1UB39_9MICO|nr:hypothetical protein [Amnibacterium setariae]RIX30536.1 hypothetical protein D1781_03685 [Amnibacterium setariae]
MTDPPQASAPDEAHDDETAHVFELTPGQRLVGLASQFETSQHELLRLVSFVERQREVIDDARARAREAVRAHQPAIDDETFDRSWDALQEAREVRPGDLEAGEPAEVTSVALDRLFASLPQGYSFRYIATILGAHFESPGTSVLLSSLLGALIADFEVLLAGLVRELIDLHPGLLSTSDRQFAWKDVIAYESLDAFKESVVEKAVDSLLRESYVEQMRWLETRAHVTPPPIATDLTTREVLQRRHVHMHNGGRVSAPYLENLRGLRPEPELGTLLPVSADYLRDAADRLLIVTLTITARIAYSVMKDPEEVEHVERFLGDSLYRLLQQARHRVVDGVSREVNSSPFQSGYTALVVKVNGWLALKRLGRFSECEAEVRAWDTSALAQEFALARFALLDETAAAYEIVQRIRGTPSLSVEFWLSWPLLEELRTYEEGVRNTGTTPDAE